MSEFRGPASEGRPGSGPATGPPTVTTTATGIAKTVPRWAEPTPQAAVAPRRPSRLRRVMQAGALMGLFGVALSACAIVSLRWLNPPTTAMILADRFTGTSIRQTWKPLEQMSPHLARAVIVSEDGQFCFHHGVDWRELEEAFERSIDGTPRGGSTISMQLAKNLFLWRSKSYIRKAIEIPLTLAMEVLVPKRRLFEIYLNIAEFGPGVYGAEAASQYHFKKSALDLTVSEAARLAVTLPAPSVRTPGQPSPLLQRLASNIETRMKTAEPRVGCLARDTAQARTGQAAKSARA